MGFKLGEGKGLREGWDSKELWKSVEKLKALPFARRERWAGRNSNGGDLVAPRPWLEEIDQFVHGHFDVAQNGAQQAWTKSFA